MNIHTHITDANGTELDLGHPDAAFHFVQVGHIQNGVVILASEIQGRHLSHRLTFSSFYLDAASTGRTMGFLLHHEMLAMEATMRWEQQLAHDQHLAAVAA